MLGILKNKKFLYIFIGYLPLSISLIFTPIYTYYLPVQDYGFLNLFNSLVGIIAPILHIGLKDGFGFLYWKYHDKLGSEELFRKTFGAMLVVQVITITLVLLFGKLVFAHYFEFLNDEDYQDFFYVLIFYACFLNLNDLFFYYFRNSDQLKQFVLLNVLSTLSMTIGSVIGIIVLNKGIAGAVYGRAIGYFAVVIYFVIKNLKNLLLELKFTKTLLIAGIPILFSSLLGSYSSNLDKYYLQKHNDLSFMAIYGISLTIIYVIEVLLISIFHFLLPDTIKKIKENVPKELIVRSIKEVFVIFVFFILLVLAVSPYVIKIFPLKYSETLYFLPFMAINPIIKFWGTFKTVNFYLNDRSTVFLKIQATVFILTLATLFIIPTSIGIYGAVIMLLANSLFQLLVSHLFVLKGKRFELNDAGILIVSLALIILFVILGIAYFYKQTSYYYLILVFVSLVMIFFIERKVIISIIEKTKSTVNNL